MLDVVVGIVIFLFLFLGLREGLAKSLTSVIAIFVSLFASSGAVNLLAKGIPQFSDPKYPGAIIVFLVVWIAAYVILDLLLTLVLRKVVKIIFLGPVDNVGGALVGGFKGMLICGIVLQLALAMPLQASSKQAIGQSFLAKYSIYVYQKTYPFARKMAPIVNKFVDDNIIDKIGRQEKLQEKTKDLEKLSPEKFVGEAVKYEKVKTEQEQKIMQLLKDQKLLRGAPLKKIEEIK